MQKWKLHNTYVHSTYTEPIIPLRIEPITSALQASREW